jgi:signal peptidase I
VSKKRKQRKQPNHVEVNEGAGTPEDKGNTKKHVRQQTFGQWLLGWAKSIVIALVIFFFVQAMLFKAFRIISNSLEPTLLVGDWLFINKALYGAQVPLVKTRLPAFREPRAGELIVLKGVEEPVLTIVKRVMGVAGDTLAMRNDSVFRNNEYVPEPYVQHIDPLAHMDPAQRAYSRSWQVPHLVDTVATDSYMPDLRNWGPFVIPEGHLFMMGDNRDSSYDGRHWGFLPRENVIGHPMFIYWSYNPDSWRPLPFITAVRWGRLFHRPK